MPRMQLRLYPFPRDPVDIAPLCDRIVVFPSTTMLHRCGAPRLQARARESVEDVQAHVMLLCPADMLWFAFSTKENKLADHPASCCSRLSANQHVA